MTFVPTVALSALLSLAARGASPQEIDPPIRQTIRDPTTRFALERAVRIATERLERPDCGKVLSDFRDDSGRTIQEKLDLLGETPRCYLARVVFREALDSRTCRNPAILAFTTVGGREVLLCSPRFWQAYKSDPGRVEALLIHEMMHTLGLGENPPSPLEIDAQILKRCR